MFLPFLAQVSDQWEDIFRPCDFRSIVIWPEITPPELKAGHDLGRFCRADPFNRLKIVIPDCLSFFINKPADILGNFTDIPAPCSPADDRLDQLRIRKSCRSF